MYMASPAQKQSGSSKQELGDLRFMDFFFFFFFSETTEVFTRKRVHLERHMEAVRLQAPEPGQKGQRKDLRRTGRGRPAVTQLPF